MLTCFLFIFFGQHRGGTRQKWRNSFTKTYSFYSVPVSYLREETGQKRCSTCLPIFYSLKKKQFREGRHQKGVVVESRLTVSTLYYFYILDEEQVKKRLSTCLTFFYSSLFLLLKEEHAKKNVIHAWLFSHLFCVDTIEGEHPKIGGIVWPRHAVSTVYQFHILEE